MPRKKKIDVILRSTRDESAWIAEAQDGSGITAQHYVPATAILVLTERLSEYHEAEVEVSYEFELPPSLQAEIDELLEAERRLQEMTHIVPAKRAAVAQALTHRHLRQTDMAAIMHLSQGYLAMIIKRAATGGYTKMRGRRRSGTAG